MKDSYNLTVFYHDGMGKWRKVVKRGIIFKIHGEDFQDSWERFYDMESKVLGNKHNAELQRTDPGIKVTGEFSARGHIFPPNV